MALSLLIPALVTLVLQAATPLVAGPAGFIGLAEPLEPRATSPQAPADPFPAPTEGLKIELPREGEPTLLNVLGEFSRVTGQSLHLSEAARLRLRETPIGLLRAVEVPPSEVYPFVEGLLWQSGFALIDGREVEPPMLAIKSAHGDERSWAGGILQGCITVDAKDLGAYARHSALLIQTVVELPGASRAGLADAMKYVAPQSGLPGMIVVGDTVILRGTGRQVAQMAQMLRAIRELTPAQNPNEGPTQPR